MQALEHGNEIPGFNQFLDEHVYNLIEPLLRHDTSELSRDASDGSIEPCFRAVDKSASREAKRDYEASLQEMYQSISEVTAISAGSGNLIINLTGSSNLRTW